MALITLDETLYENADRTKVVSEGDPDAAFLVGRKGMQMADTEAERLGVQGTPVARDAAQQVEQERLDAALERGAVEEALSRELNIRRAELSEKSQASQRSRRAAGTSRTGSGDAGDEQTPEQKAISAPAENKALSGPQRAK